MKLATMKFLLFSALLVLHTMQAMEQAPLNSVASLKDQAKQKVISLLRADQGMEEKINSDTFTEDLRKEILHDMHLDDVRSEQFILLNSCLQNCLKTLPINQGMLNCLKLDETGLYVITGSDNKVAHIWYIKTGECLFTLDGHSEGVSAVALNRESKQAFTATYDNKLYFWDLQQENLKPVEIATEYTITSILIDPKNKQEIITLDGGNVCRWNCQTATCIQKMSRAVFDSCGHELLLQVEVPDFSVPVINKYGEVATQKNGEPIKPLMGHTALVTAGKVNKNDTLALTGTEQGEAFLWNLETGTCLNPFYFNFACPVRLLDFCDNDQRAIFVSEDNSIVIVPFKPTSENQAAGIRITHQIDSIVCAHNYIVTVKLQDQSYALLDLIKRQVQIIGSLSPINYRDKNYMFAGRADGSLDLMELETQRFLSRTAAHENPILCLDSSISNTGAYAATGCKDGSCKLWDLKHNLDLHEIQLIIELRKLMLSKQTLPFDSDKKELIEAILAKNAQSRNKFLWYFGKQLEHYGFEKVESP